VESKSATSPDFGHYFAGIVDGEAHFAIRRGSPKGKPGYACAFVLIMRDDDSEFVEWLRETTGLGAVYYQPERQKVGHLSRPQVMWKVQNKADCCALADILEEYPLRTRKARDCAIWIKAVRYQAGPRPQNWEPMARWFAEIRAVREYDSVERELDETLEEYDALSLFPEEAWA
jgi:hypothetical protein